MQAVVEISGKQYLVEQGSLVTVADQGKESGSEIVLDKVLLVNDQGETHFNKPGVVVKATVVEDVLSKKIRVFKHHAKKRYRRTQGHRQPYTVLRVQVIEVA